MAKPILVNKEGAKHLGGMLTLNKVLEEFPEIRDEHGDMPVVVVLINLPDAIVGLIDSVGIVQMEDNKVLTLNVDGMKVIGKILDYVYKEIAEEKKEEAKNN